LVTNTTTDALRPQLSVVNKWLGSITIHFTPKIDYTSCKHPHGCQLHNTLRMENMNKSNLYKNHARHYMMNNSTLVLCQAPIYAVIIHTLRIKLLLEHVIVHG